SGYLSRHRTMVHQHGCLAEGPAHTAARSDARGNSNGEVDSRVGRGSHGRNDQWPPRLVRFAPALLGRAHHRVLLRRMRKAARKLSGAAQWRKENDILDVWFDSGSSHLAVLQGPQWPADVYLEGPDQYRGWFHSSLLIGIGTRRHPPYRGVVTHGWTLDEHGRPMSKSLGNVVLPAEICEKWGADLLRLWVSSVEYQ